MYPKRGQRRVDATDKDGGPGISFPSRAVARTLPPLFLQSTKSILQFYRVRRCEKVAPGDCDSVPDSHRVDSSLPCRCLSFRASSLLLHAAKFLSSDSVRPLSWLVQLRPSNRNAQTVQRHRSEPVNHFGRARSANWCTIAVRNATKPTWKLGIMTCASLY